ncbi:hypothetical protein PMJ10TS2_07020 [Paenibacillus melissococcoides]
MEHIEEIALNQESLKSKMNTDEKERSKIEQRLSTLNVDLNNVLERRKKWQYMFAEDLITEDELRERNKEEQKLMTSLKKEIETLNNKLTSESHSIDKLLSIPDIWKSLTDTEKNEMMRIIFKDIVLQTPLEKARGVKGKFIPASIQEITFN